jgi:hypothetical protein
LLELQQYRFKLIIANKKTIFRNFQLREQIQTT